MDEKEIKIIGALENDKFKWRTIDGIANDTNISKEEIASIISKCDDLIIKSNIPSIDGKELFTTRKQLKKKATLSEKFAAVINNRSSS